MNLDIKIEYIDDSIIGNGKEKSHLACKIFISCFEFFVCYKNLLLDIPHFFSCYSTNPYLFYLRNSETNVLLTCDHVLKQRHKLALDMLPLQHMNTDIIENKLFFSNTELKIQD